MDEWFDRKKALVRDVVTDHLVRLGSKPKDSKCHRCLVCARCICVRSEFFVDEYETSVYLDMAAQGEIQIQAEWAKYVEEHGDPHLKFPVVKLPKC